MDRSMVEFLRARLADEDADVEVGMNRGRLWDDHEARVHILDAAGVCAANPDDPERGAEWFVGFTLRAMALPYSWHPDWRPEWRP